MTTETVRPARAPGVAAVARFTRRTVAEAAAVAQAGLGTLLVLAAAERPSLLTSTHRGAFAPWLAGPLHGLLPGLTRDGAVLHRDFRALLLIMCGLWLLVLLGGRTVRPGVVVGAVVALHVAFLLAPPFRLTDVFNYLGYARLDVLAHADPYVVLPLAGHADPVFAYSNWHRLLSPYGPLFTLITLPTARLPLATAFWAYKGLDTAASLGLLAAVWAAARRLGRPPAAAVAFVGLNPVVLVYALGGQHNDLLMMACLIGAAVLVLARRELAGGALLTAAVAIKASAGLLAPLVALAAPRRLRALAGAAAAAVVLGGMTLVVFGPHLPDVHDQDRLVGAYSVPNLAGYELGRGGADASVRRVAAIVLAVGVGACLLVAWRRRGSALTAAGWAALLAVACVSWLMPWYILWALPFAALSRSHALRGATVLAALWVALIWSGLVPQLAHERGIVPSLTAVGRANHAVMDGFILGRAPAAGRRGAPAGRRGAPAARRRRRRAACLGGPPILRAPRWTSSAPTRRRHGVAVRAPARRRHGAAGASLCRLWPPVWPWSRPPRSRVQPGRARRRTTGPSARRTARSRPPSPIAAARSR